MASKGFCSVIEFGKLSWPEIIDYETYLGANDSEEHKKQQDQMEVDKMIEIFKNVK